MPDMTTTNDKKQTAPLVVIAAGGTGGHMFPAQAFAETMMARGWRIGLITDDRGMRFTDSFPAEWIDQAPAATMGSKRPDKMIAAAMRIRAGRNAAKARMKTHRPHIVVGFGGYPSFPALWAARGLKIPIVIHEQNAVLGRVNRVFAGAAKFVASGFERLDRLPASVRGRHKVVGNPVRAPIRAVRNGAYPAISDGGMFNILVTGGSQGAKMFGEVVPAAIQKLDPVMRRRLVLIQQARDDQIETIRATYGKCGVECVLQPFFSDMAARLSRAHLVIARSGAGTVTELCVAGRPAIFIPLGIAMDDHQRANAEAMEAAGAADVILEKDFTPERLAEVLGDRLADPEDLAQRAARSHALAPGDAASDLADLAEQAAGLAQTPRDPHSPPLDYPAAN